MEKRGENVYRGRKMEMVKVQSQINVFIHIIDGLGWKIVEWLIVN